MLFDSLRNNSRILVYVVVIAFAGGGLLWGVSGLFTDSKAPQQNSAAYAQEQARENIAVVNGVGIPYKNYLQVLQATQQQYGGQIGANQTLALKSSVLDQLINRELLLQKAKKDNLNVKVSDKEVEKQLDKYVNKYANSKKEFEKLLQKNGQNLEQFRTGIKEGLKNQKLLQKESQKLKSGVKVSETELKEAYKEATGATEAKGEEFEKAKQELKEKVKSQKEKQAIGKVLKEYKKNSEIEINSVELKAYQAAKNDNFKQAVTGYKQAIQQNKNKAYLYTNLAQAYQKQGADQEALKTYEKAVKKDPENAELRLAFGKFYYQTDAKEKAVKQLDKASKLAGNDLLTHYRLQRIYKEMGYEKKAKAELNKVKELQKKKTETYKKQLQQNQQNKTKPKQ